MPRRPRSFAEGLFHISPHASDDRALFPTAAWRNRFLPALSSALASVQVGLVAYVLMGTHYHAVVNLSDERLPHALRRLHTWYATFLNNSHDRTAHVFRAHYSAREIRGDHDLLGVCRYLAYNPVRAGLADTPFDWPWSSVRATARLERAKVSLDLGPVRAAFGDWDGWEAAYRDFIAAGDEPR